MHVIMIFTVVSLGYVYNTFEALKGFPDMMYMYVLNININDIIACNYGY